MRTLRRKMRKDDTSAATYVIDQAWGKAAQPVEVSGTVTLRSAAVEVLRFIESIGKSAEFEAWLSAHSSES
jgi:hypothetical protein